ncbi:sigma-70 family RNA polymerase sigma factor [Leuconostoc gelidum subsp. aenigmaticum]|uniref:hypothetical protein n=1 Tax=Leuconostoc gelidum TaxID=1244 RepID=UPI001CC7CB17|nr:hypothetical protein [Leuconostoc gelidum]MBZ6003946.1 sigma-70 family RNA polymerase sigma factor [Leuconostoc gelidum subsp. aenigmaticum]
MSGKEITIEQLNHAHNKNNIISNFMSLSDTKQLIKQHQNSTLSDTVFNQKLNKDFRAYFSYVLFLSYLNKTLYFKSIHTKQKSDNIKHQNIPLDSVNIYQLPSLSNSIDSSLIRSLPWQTILSPRQIFVLNKIYVEGYKQNEVAKLIDITAPAVNKIKKTSLLTIKKYIDDQGENK